MARAWLASSRRILRRGVVALALMPACGAQAADFRGYSSSLFGTDEPDCTQSSRPPASRYFPRSDGDSITDGPPAPPFPFIRCTTNLTLVPTDSPLDPSYVGSAYGLSRPSYYGLTPPPGVGDPFGRSPLPYCP